MRTILVTGATGSQGSPVVRQLLDAGFTVRALARTPEKATDLVARGATFVSGDLGDPDVVRDALRDVDGVFLLVPFFADPAAGVAYGRHVIDAAKAAGVRLIVWNPTGEIPPAPTGNPAVDLRREVRDHLLASGVPSVILQPTAYMENLLGPWTRDEIAEQDTFAYPTPNEVSLQWIATEDVARFAVAAFRHPEVAPLDLRIAGPERLDGETAAARFAAALGRPIRFRAMPPREFGQKLDAVFPGMGEGVTRAYEMAYAHPERFSTNVDVDAALAALPVRLTSLEEWARAHANAFGAVRPATTA